MVSDNGKKKKNLRFYVLFPAFSQQPNEGSQFSLQCLFSYDIIVELRFLCHFWISGGAKQWPKLFPGFSKRYGTDFALFTSFRKKGVRFVASGATGRNGGVVEISEGETAPRSYVWPDKKVAICVNLCFVKVSEEVSYYCNWIHIDLMPLVFCYNMMWYLSG